MAGWLAQPALVGGTDRNGFLLKFFFGTPMPPEAMRALLDDYRESLEATRADFAALIERLARIPSARMGRHAALHGLRIAQARLAWIDEVEAEVTEPSVPPTADGTDPYDTFAHHYAGSPSNKGPRDNT